MARARHTRLEHRLQRRRHVLALCGFWRQLQVVRQILHQASRGQGCVRQSWAAEQGQQKVQVGVASPQGDGAAPLALCTHATGQRARAQHGSGRIPVTHTSFANSEKLAPQTQCQQGGADLGQGIGACLPCCCLRHVSNSGLSSLGKRADVGWTVRLQVVRERDRRGREWLQSVGGVVYLLCREALSQQVAAAVLVQHATPNAQPSGSHGDEGRCAAQLKVRTERGCAVQLQGSRATQGWPRYPGGGHRLLLPTHEPQDAEPEDEAAGECGGQGVRRRRLQVASRARAS